MLEAKEVADLLGVQAQTVIVWAKKKKIPSYKFDAVWRFKEDEIDDWITGKKVELDVE